MTCSTLRAPSAVLVCKSCRCGQSFTADQWLDLKPIGLMDGGDDYTMLDLRNCPCGSTLATEVEIVADPNIGLSPDMGLRPLLELGAWLKARLQLQPIRLARVYGPAQLTTLPAPPEES